MSWNDLRKGRSSEQYQEYFITFNTLDRIPYFNDFSAACLFCRQVEVNQVRHRCTWLTWVLMPDHFHGLVRIEHKNSNLSAIVGDLKGSSAYKLNKYFMKKGKIWQPSFYDTALRADDDRLNIARYIVANPLRGGLVKSIRNYPFWDSIYL